LADSGTARQVISVPLSLTIIAGLPLHDESVEFPDKARAADRRVPDQGEGKVKAAALVSIHLVRLWALAIPSLDCVCLSRAKQSAEPSSLKRLKSFLRRLRAEAGSKSPDRTGGA
jgi:hypothetical protein